MLLEEHAKLITERLRIQLNSVLYLPIPCLRNPEPVERKIIRPLYDNLSDIEFSNLNIQKGLCGTSSIAFGKVLESMGYFYRRLVICFKKILVDEMESKGFNREYSSKIYNLDFIGADKKAIQKNTVKDNSIGGHSILEIKINGRFYILDPFNGLFYPYSKEDLIRNPKLASISLSYMNQAKYLKNSIHQNRNTLLFATPSFWSGVIHMGPSTNSNKYDIS